MKNILIVDDESAFTMSVRDGLKPFSDRLAVFTAENGKEALKVLESNEIHLVVTDLNMPEMNGLELLAYMSRRFPKIPAIVMTAFGTPEIEKRARKLGSNQFLEKPLDIELLRKKIFEEIKKLAKGYLSGIGLTSFLQMVELEKKSMTLNIKSGRNFGTLHINRGQLVDAQSGDITGLEAAYEIVSWRNAEIEISDGNNSSEKPIKAQLTHVILESMRRSEDAAREKEEAKTKKTEKTAPTGQKTNDAKETAKTQNTEQEVSKRDKADDTNTKNNKKTKTQSERRAHMANQRSSTDVLQELTETRGVMTVAIVGRDGYPIEFAGDTSKIDVDGLGATISVMVDAAETTGTDLEIEPFEQVTLEYKGAVIAVVPVADALMAVVSPDNKTLGMVRFKMKKFLPELAQFF